MYNIYLCLTIPHLNVSILGLSNFNSQQIDEVVNMARIQPTMLQVEVHPYLVQNELINHCKKHNMLGKI